MQLYRRGVDNVQQNTVVNRMYTFRYGSLAVLQALLTYAYTGSIPGAPQPR